MNKPWMCEHDFSDSRWDGDCEEALCRHCRIGIVQYAMQRDIPDWEIDAVATALLTQHYGRTDRNAIDWVRERPDRFRRWRNKALVALVAAIHARAALNHGDR